MLFVILLIITIFIALLFFGTFADDSKSKKSTKWILGLLTLLFAFFSLNSCKANLAKKHDENVKTEKTEKKQADKKKKQEAKEKKQQEAKEEKHQKEIDENTQPFEDDVTQEMESESVSVQFNSVTDINLTVPDEATLVNSSARKTYATELINIIEKQAESYNMDRPYVTIVTQSGTKFARSTAFGGVKVYDED